MNLFTYIPFLFPLIFSTCLHAADLKIDVDEVCSLMAEKMGSGFEVNNKNFASGGEGKIITAKRNGKKITAKITDLSHRSPDAVRSEARNVNRVLEKNGDVGKKYFLPAEILELSADGSNPILITELVPWDPLKPDGSHAPNLRQMIMDNFSRYPVEKRAAMKEKILGQVAEAAALMENAGVAHRDLSYRNILVDRFGDIKIVDWGISAPYGERPITSAGHRRQIGTRRFWGIDQVSEEPASPHDDVENIRRLSWYTLAEPETAEANRVKGIVIDDFTGTPEGPGVNPAIAIAHWSRLPRTPKEYLALAREARELPLPQFLKNYGRRLVEKDSYSGRNPVARNGASDLIDSAAKVENFPDGLGLSSKERDALIRGVIELYHQTHGEEGAPYLPMSGPHGYQKFDEFFDRVEALQKQNKLWTKFDLPHRVPLRPKLRWSFPPWHWMPQSLRDN